MPKIIALREGITVKKVDGGGLCMKGVDDGDSVRSPHAFQLYLSKQEVAQLLLLLKTEEADKPVDREQRLKDSSDVVGIYDTTGDVDPVEYVRSLRE